MLNEAGSRDQRIGRNSGRRVQLLDPKLDQRWWDSESGRDAAESLCWSCGRKRVAAVGRHPVGPGGLNCLSNSRGSSGVPAQCARLKLLADPQHSEATARGGDCNDGGADKSRTVENEQKGNPSKRHRLYLYLELTVSVYRRASANGNSQLRSSDGRTSSTACIKSGKGN